jgi:nucleoside-diphosphate-sugar epimerase
MKISILGAGWLGLPLGEALIQEGHEVKGSTTSSEKLDLIKEKGLTPYFIDLDQEEELPLDFFQTDILILTLPPGRRDPNVQKNYARRIQKVMEAIQNSSIQHHIYTSSTGVYGEQEGLITEQHPLKPNTNSSKAVYEAEQALNKTDIRLTILRLAGLVGGERKPGRFLAGKKELADGEAPVNLVHRDDCIGVIQSIIRQKVWGEVFNVCADEHPSRAVFYIDQAKKLGLEPPSFMEEEKTKPYKVISNRKVKEILGYNFKDL